MGRLTQVQWEQARAEYEVRGITLQEVAKRFGVDRAAVSRRAKKESWEQGKSHAIVEKKVTAIKALAEAEAESHALPVTFQHTIETVTSEKLEAEGVTASFAKAIARRGILLAEKAMPEELELLSRAHRNISPQTARENSTTVNVNQQQAQGVQILSPKDVLAEIVESAREDNGGDGA